MPGTCTVTIGSDSWSVSLANTYPEIVAGLAGLVSLTADTGMLFDLGADQSIGVTTQLMLFNIDIVFISADGVVTSIERDVAPGNYISGYGRYWLEVNAEEAVHVSVDDTTVTVCAEVPVLEEEPTSSWEELMSMMVGLVVIVMMVDMGYQMFKPKKK